MIHAADIRAWRTHDVVDPQGHRIGVLEAVYVPRRWERVRPGGHATGGAWLRWPTTVRMRVLGLRDEWRKCCS